VARMMCPVKKMEINVPDECPQDCMHFKLGMCTHPDMIALMGQSVTRSGIPIKPIYTPEDLGDWDFKEKLGEPGGYPYTRENRPMMPPAPAKAPTKASTKAPVKEADKQPAPMSSAVRDAAMRGASQYAGFGTAETTNEWFKFLLSQGATNLSAACDLPTQIGYDADHPLALGEVGKSGVHIGSLADMEAMLDGIPLGEMGVGSVVSAMGPIYLAWTIAVCEKRGIPLQEVRFFSQNDCLKEFMARGTQIFPVKPQVKFNCDLVEFCARNNMIYARPMQISGYHIREAGATAPQELAFTMANAVAYIDELVGRGLSVDDFVPLLFVFFAGGIDLFEEACKYRAFRRMWAKIMKERYQSTNPAVLHCACTSYTAGSYYTAQQPLNNIVRGTIELLSAILGGLPGATVSSYDEALALPSPEAVRVALRTQQIVAEETGVNRVLDPLGGSYYVEALTDELEARATEIFDKVQSMGGAIAALEQGYQQREIAVSAYERLKKVESGETVVVGVNKYAMEEPTTIEVRKVDPEEERRQVEKVKKLKQERDNDKVNAALARLKKEAEEGVNLVPCLIDTVKTYATLGEICDTLRGVWGEFKPVTL